MNDIQAFINNKIQENISLSDIKKLIMIITILMNKMRLIKLIHMVMKHNKLLTDMNIKN